eukprot:Partr_v1_DN28797_c3_g1_i8_m62481 putative NA
MTFNLPVRYRPHRLYGSGIRILGFSVILYFLISFMTMKHDSKRMNFLFGYRSISSLRSRFREPFDPYDKLRKFPADPLPESAIDPNGYISYHPHSGFSNQRYPFFHLKQHYVTLPLDRFRYELENAMVIAHILNRTLVIPPAYIGHSPSFAWHEFQHMQNHLRNIDGVTYRHLIDHPGIDPQLASEIENANEFALLPWSELYDFSKLEGLVRTIDISSFCATMAWRLEYDDFLMVKDFERYSYLIVDHLYDSPFVVDGSNNDVNFQVSRDDWVLMDQTMYHQVEQFLNLSVTNGSNVREVSVPKHQYSHVLNLNGDWSMASDVRDGVPRAIPRNPALIHFGSLFGGNRVEMITSKYDGLRDRIRSALIFNNTILNDITEDIISQHLGPTYFAVHFRAGDGIFQKRLETSVTKLAEALSKWNKKFGSPIVYVATDVQDFFTNATFTALEPFFPQFRMLNQFQDAMAKLDLFTVRRNEMSSHPAWTSEMTQLFDLIDVLMDQDVTKSQESRVEQALKGALDERELRIGDTPPPSTFGKRMIKFIDQMICARAQSVIGTSGSTFSGDIKTAFYAHHGIAKGNKNTQHTFKTI